MSEDIVAVTKGISVKDLIAAYEVGIFPWPCFDEERDLVPWFFPETRGILEFESLHIPRSVKKDFKRSNFKATFCLDFSRVINECAKAKRKNQSETWINDSILKSYQELFNLKKAYSVEVWNNEMLVGGLYGVISSRYISGESMFYKETGSSKFALISLVERLRSLNLSWIDTQMTTPLLKSFGGREICKKEFKKKLNEGKIIDANFYKELAYNGSPQIFENR